MKLIFNDATELTIQSADIQAGGNLLIRTISETPEKLKMLFQDTTKTRKMIVKEREDVLVTYENYENFYSITEYTGGIFGVAMCKKEDLPEVKAEIQNAAVMVAQIQAQELTDLQALQVQAIYPEWSEDGVEYAKDYKIQYNNILYKCVQAHTSQSDWAPGVAPSLWTAIANPSSSGTKENPITVPERSNMKLIFNDATELTIQSADIQAGGNLLIRTISETPEKLKMLFQDTTKTRKMIVKEREDVLVTYENYENFYSITEYTGGIFGVAMCKKEDLPEVKAEIQNAAVMVAQIQAQELTDLQALQVQAIYPEWSEDGVEYAKDYKIQYNNILYKCVQAHTSQSDWAPGVAPSLWTAIANPSSSGTKENPITVPEMVTTAGMEYVKGKYYSWNEKVYLMNRVGMTDGESIILYFSPDTLVGQYFEEV